VDTRAHRDLALRSARESLVLLKNDNNVLPLGTDNNVLPLGTVSARPSHRRTIALIGPHSNSTTDILGAWASLFEFVCGSVLGCIRLRARWGFSSSTLCSDYGFTPLQVTLGTGGLTL
jgi:beta-glucosidase-like glycosyl hydrolase